MTGSILSYMAENQVQSCFTVLTEKVQRDAVVMLLNILVLKSKRIPFQIFQLNGNAKVMHW